MSCNIIEGSYLDCKQNPAGIKGLYVAQFENVSSVTSSSGSVTAISMTGKFWTYQVRPEDAELKVKTTSTLDNGTVYTESTLTWQIFKLSAKNRNIVDLLVKNRLMVIVAMVDGTNILLGETRGLDITTVDSGTGKAMGDKVTYMITMVGKEPTDNNYVSSAIVTANT